MDTIVIQTWSQRPGLRYLNWSRASASDEALYHNAMVQISQASKLQFDSIAINGYLLRKDYGPHTQEVSMAESKPWGGDAWHRRLTVAPIRVHVHGTDYSKHSDMAIIILCQSYHVWGTMPIAMLNLGIWKKPRRSKDIKPAPECINSLTSHGNVASSLSHTTNILASLENAFPPLSHDVGDCPRHIYHLRESPCCIATGQRNQH